MKKSILLLATAFTFILAVITINCEAQWQHTSLDSGTIRHFTKMGSILFANTEDHGMYKSKDNGITWSSINNDLPYPDIRAIAIKGTKVFIGDNSGAPFDSLGGIFVSNDTGSTWVRVYRQNPDPSGITFLTVHDSTIYAGIGYSGIHKSTDDGLHWIALADSIPSSTETLKMVVKDSILIAGTSGSGVYTSSDNGINWAVSNNGLGTQFIFNLSVNNNEVFAGTMNGGVFISLDNCSSWTAINNGIPTGSYSEARDFAFYGNRIFAGNLEGGVFLSNNNGQNWTAVNQGLSDTFVLSLFVDSNYIFAGTDSGIFKRPLSDLTYISEINNDNNISVFPNPATNNLVIETLQKSTMEIFNIQGQLINSFNAIESQTTIDISSLVRGMYFVKVKTDKGIGVKKFIKE